MKYLKIIIVASTIMASQFTKAQGIQFQENPENLNIIMAQAKKEHKLIFIDCYATWCGPCKKMDQEVYLQDSIGAIFNQQFINIRLQLDRTDHDDDKVKKSRQLASGLEKNYAINAYPTFLFLDFEGNPLHKAIGYRSPKEFIQLAKDAQDPAKQYYKVLKDFKPGKIDTAEEKSLARIFAYQDESLAGKIAADYLERISKKQLGTYDNKRLIVQFQKNADVVSVAVKYLNSLNKLQFSNNDNFNLMSALGKQVAIRDIAFNYIKSLGQNELFKANNLNFVRSFNSDSLIKRTIKGCIDKSPQEKFYTKEGIQFLEAFTDSPEDRGFQIFFGNPAKINQIMADNDYAQYTVDEIITKTEILSLINEAKKTGIEPNWKTIRAEIAHKYNSSYADRLVLESKINWTKFLADTKNNDQTWTTFIGLKLEQMKEFRYDTLDHGSYKFINTLSWAHGFHHATQPEQLNEYINYMKRALNTNPESVQTKIDYLDTYACLLYKVGRIPEALEYESKIFDIAEKASSRRNIDHTKLTIEKMKKGEQIWLLKEFQ